MNNVIVRFTKTREDEIMCKTLERLRGKRAVELLEEYNMQTTPPIDISLLLKKIGITEVATDFTKIEEVMECEKGDVLGAILARGNSLSIFHRSDDTLNRKRFTLAHEIAHCCLDTDSLKKHHVELRSVQSANNAKEYNANVFAGELLIPEMELRDIHNQFLVAPTLSDLAMIFQVSATVMAARLDYLNLSYIKDVQMDEN